MAKSSAKQIQSWTQRAKRPEQRKRIREAEQMHDRRIKRGIAEIHHAESGCGVNAAQRSHEPQGSRSRDAAIDLLLREREPIWTRDSGKASSNCASHERFARGRVDALTERRAQAIERRRDFQWRESAGYASEDVRVEQPQSETGSKRSGGCKNERKQPKTASQQSSQQSSSSITAPEAVESRIRPARQGNRASSNQIAGTLLP